MGSDLGQRYIDLQKEVTPCDVDVSELHLDSDPRCPGCRVALGHSPPGAQVEAFVRDVDQALGEQNRRLSQMLVERILHGWLDQRLEGFLKIVQASDLSSLSNVLNAELVQFIQQLLRSP